MKKAIVVLLASIPLIAGAGAAATVAAQSSSSQPVNGDAMNDIPPAYLTLYQDAGQRFSVPWQIIAAIGRVESDHGRNPNAYRPNYAGAVGPMQFLPTTFVGYSWAAGHPNPDILDPHDAIFAAAAMLAADGVQTNVWGAIFAYNHADWYVEMVLRQARAYGWPG